MDYPEFFRNDHMMLECAESLDGFLSQRSSIPFNLVMIPRKTWETIGFLDEQFDGYGCDDDDYNYRIWKAGGYIAYTSRALAYHEGSTAFNEVYEQAVLTEKYNSNLRKFYDKWGDMNFRHFPSPERCQMVYTHQHGVKTRIYL
jgi:GT2 family glycosyltransferase